MTGASAASTAPTGGDRIPPAGGDLEWRRLSARMLVIHPIQELVRAIPLLFGLLVAGSSSGDGGLWSLGALTVVVALGVLRWFTTTYRVTPDHVQVRRGLLRRRLLAVPRDRVRTVDVTAPPMHRLLGLARVTIGTGRSDRNGGGGVRLDALAAPDASRLRVELLHRRAAPRTMAEPVSAEAELAVLRPEWVRYAPFTLSGIVTLGVIGAFAWRGASEAHVDPRRLGPLRDVSDQITGAPLGLALVETALACIVLVAITSTLGYVVAFWRFRLTRHPEGTLHVTRGLVTTRATTIEERRLHGVEIGEPLLLRIVRGARCTAIATGLRVGRGAERGGSLLLPPAPRAEAMRVAAEVMGDEDPVTCALTEHGRRARRRRFTRALAACAAPIVALVGIWAAGDVPAGAWEGSLVLLAVGWMLAVDRYRSLGHAIAGGSLVSRQGSLVRRRSMLSCDGIIGWNVRRTFFQRRAGLVTLTATTAAGRQRYLVPDVELGEALRVAEEAVPGLVAPFLVGR